MKKVVKTCSFCRKEFDIKSSKERIALEFRQKNDFLKLYFCSNECFRDFIKKQDWK